MYANRALEKPILKNFDVSYSCMMKCMLYIYGCLDLLDESCWSWSSDLRHCHYILRNNQHHKIVNLYWHHWHWEYGCIQAEELYCGEIGLYYLELMYIKGVAVNQWFSRIWLDFILLDKIYIKQYNWITLQYMYFILTFPPKYIHIYYFNAIYMFILPLKSTKDLVLKIETIS